MHGAVPTEQKHMPLHLFDNIALLTDVFHLIMPNTTTTVH